MATETTTCCVVGGGPAGTMLGLLLARAGIGVVVLEKHADFLRDFRGDTVHPSTMTVLDELGLGERFQALPQRHIPDVSFITEQAEFTFAELAALRHPHPYIALVPQWDFLDLVTAEAARYPTSRLRMRAEATGVIREGGRVVGVRYRAGDGEEHEVRAALTVAADGRHSVVRRAVGLTPVEYAAPMDVLWFRLPRRESDPGGIDARPATGGFAVLIDRGDYWQVAHLVRKGAFAEIKSRGLQRFREDVARTVPLLADRVAELDDWRDVSMLSVRVDRLPRWHLPGLLLIGDAAHAMSPIGGVGINLAVQDAVASANLLAEPLRRGRVGDADLAAVQQRRDLPTRVTQGLQRAAQAGFIDPLLRGEREATPPAPLRLLSRLRPGRHFTAWLVGVGIRPEHVRTPELSPAASAPAAATAAGDESVPS